jgi:hypothetical protein
LYIRSILFFKKVQLAGVSLGLSNSGHLLYFFKKLKITLTGSNPGNLTMFKKIFQATRFTGVKKIIEIVQTGATMPNLM